MVQNPKTVTHSMSFTLVMAGFLKDDLCSFPDNYLGTLLHLLYCLPALLAKIPSLRLMASVSFFMQGWQRVDPGAEHPEERVAGR